ncbi:MAG: segregation/condensation protein A [Ruminococcaceae bacterium]|nr:segregation/condensation protein A [Oscillospiraceae bacterium]
MEKISYKLEVFEGPMDLLLSLISKRKLDIMDIPIIELVEQYMDYVRQMQEANMEVASEFLEMAARLVYIKTVSLLPKHEEADLLKQELQGELLEYRDCQIMAGKLRDTANGFEFLTKEPDKIDRDETYELLHEPLELLRAYISALGKGQRKLPPPITSFTALVARKIVSVESKILSIKNAFKSKRKINLKSLFESSKTRSDLVATFLAVLELVKKKEVLTKGAGDNMEIELKKKKN